MDIVLAAVRLTLVMQNRPPKVSWNLQRYPQSDHYYLLGTFTLNFFFVTEQTSTDLSDMGDIGINVLFPSSESENLEVSWDNGLVTRSRKSKGKFLRRFTLLDQIIKPTWLK